MLKQIDMYIRLILLSFCFQIGACQSHSQPSEIRPNNTSIDYLLVADGLENPWGMAFLPNGDILVTEKKGEIRIVRAGKLLPDKIEGVPDVYIRGQGGLLDIELHPDFANNGWLYLSYASKDGPGTGGNTTISRFTLEGKTLINKKVLYKAQPNTDKGNHFGSRLAFDSEGYLFFSVGDRGKRDKNPQDISNDGGKIYRIRDDGSIPEDNPFFSTPRAKKATYSYGHRNPQGLAIDLTTNNIWEHEHGPQGGDEINLVKPGKNYGWPILSYGINYSGTEFAEDTVRAGMESPVIYWVPSIAPCGMTIVTGEKYHGWEGDLIVGSLKFSYLVHAKVVGDKIVSQEKVAEGIGRVRNVEQGPDGFLYVGVEGKGLFRLINEIKSIAPQMKIYISVLFIGLFFWSSCEQNQPTKIIRPIKPWAIRSVLDYKPRMLTLALDSTMYVGYDLENCRFYKAWRGGVNWDGIVFNDTKVIQPTTWGAAYSEDPDVGTSWWLEENGSKIFPDVRFDGYRFNEGQIFLLYTLSTTKDTIQIEERPEYIETEEGAPGLERVFTKKGKNDLPVYLSTQSQVVELIKKKTIFRSIFDPLPEQTLEVPPIRTDDKGRYWLEKSDCPTCHEWSENNVGPSFSAIAEKYSATEDVIAYLSNRIRQGGSGVWGSAIMNPHPTLDDNDLDLMVKFILSLDQES